MQQSWPSPTASSSGTLTPSGSIAGLDWEKNDKLPSGTVFEFTDEGDADEPLRPLVFPAGWADDSSARDAMKGPLGFVEANWFKIAVAAVILVNGLMLIVELVDSDFSDLSHQTDEVFVAFYCVEILLRLGHWKLEFFFHPAEALWNWFDLILVLAGLLEVVVVHGLAPTDSTGRSEHAGMVMALRVLRPLRLLARLARLMRVIRLLRLLMVADFTWVEGSLFQTIVGIVILINAAIMGLETDIVSPVWDWIEQILLTFFVIEALLRIRHRSWDYFTSPEDGGWNIMDFAVVMSGVVDDWILKAWRLITKSDHKGPGLGKLMTLARLMRLMRILRLIRLVRAIRPLYMLAIGIVRAMQSMFWVLVLTFTALYALAILSTRVIGQGRLQTEASDIPEETRAMFASIADSMFSLFAFMNNQEWHKVAPLLQAMPLTKVIFVVFTIYSSWALLSVMTGVVSDHIQYVREVQQQEEEHAQDEQHHQLVRTLSQIFAAADPDGSGTLRRAVYMEILNSPFQVRRLQKAVNLHVDDIKQIFDLLDLDGNGTVNFDEFCESLDWLSKPVAGRRLLRVDLGVKLVGEQMRQEVISAKSEFQKYTRDLERQHKYLMGRLDEFLIDMDERVHHPKAELPCPQTSETEQSHPADRSELQRKFTKQRSLSSGLKSCRSDASSGNGGNRKAFKKSLSWGPTDEVKFS
eukprot:TRINITY_DN28464_c0_g1_i1.p1 TRINITY_DN28464_c0_g1~~TRINITY_DN28464_c0_g1_i1.p1  ORF type:complete len:716 (-),score=147.15 TRINITY_DN28464_c0_g1_i1:132-2213(-)